ncbi:hypothetical protein PVAP13_7KG128000 [Panicum virgatum]|uniref:F-box domain-containing protein n=1 Tax=Panicum virgatum TaxID=38727 RepID=A0A8T0QFB1_PANVG|nr:hypothetical protein PVAP13_7KG128000 [Panicum virgatum]
MAKRRGKKKPGARRTRNKEASAATAAPAPLAPLPDHLVEDIFTRLPPKSVAVSRCVSPSWNRFISSPPFGRLYHVAKAAEAASDPVRFVSVPVDPDKHRKLLVIGASAAGPRGLAAVSMPCEGCPSVFCGAGMPCHGMVLADRPCRGEFFACNPSTGGVLRLPPRRPPWYFYSAGLGFDDPAGAAGTGRHKAVLLELVRTLPPSARPCCDIPKLRCSVFTVGDRQCRWRAPLGQVTPVIGGALVSTQTDPVFADGHLHWFLCRRASDGNHGDPDGILAFVLSGEFFRRIPLPSFAMGGGKPKRPVVHATLAELDGRLCLVRDLFRFPRHDAPFFEVWMLHDIMSGSWSLDRRIDLTGHVSTGFRYPWQVSVLCYVHGGESPGERRKKKIAIATIDQMKYWYMALFGGV